MRKLRFLAALAAAVIAGVAGASAVVGSTPPAATVGPESLVPDGTGAVVAVTAPDPAAAQAGGATSTPSWGVRIYRSQTGLTCPDAGRVAGGDFGTVDEKGAFRALPLDASGACADMTKSPYSLLTTHYPANADLGARAIVFGAVTKDVTGATLSVDGDERALDVAHGAFIAPLVEDDATGSTLTFALADGQRIVKTLGG